MKEKDFEGTIVLEKMAEIGKLEAFMDAVDSDDFAKAKALMTKAKIDSNTIIKVLTRMAKADGKL